MADGERAGDVEMADGEGVGDNDGNMVDGQGGGDQDDGMEDGEEPEAEVTLPVRSIPRRNNWVIEIPAKPANQLPLLQNVQSFGNLNENTAFWVARGDQTVKPGVSGYRVIGL